MLAFDLPQAANVDGLLGLDFLRDNALTVDLEPVQFAWFEPIHVQSRLLTPS
jgi:hypothetical protein